MDLENEKNDLVSPTTEKSVPVENMNSAQPQQYASAATSKAFSGPDANERANSAACNNAIDSKKQPNCVTAPAPSVSKRVLASSQISQVGPTKGCKRPHSTIFRVSPYTRHGSVSQTQDASGSDNSPSNTNNRGLSNTNGNNNGGSGKCGSKTSNHCTQSAICQRGRSLISAPTACLRALTGVGRPQAPSQNVGAGITNTHGDVNEDTSATLGSGGSPTIITSPGTVGSLPLSRSAQCHTVGSPARHPLGNQLPLQDPRFTQTSRSPELVTNTQGPANTGATDAYGQDAQNSKDLSFSRYSEIAAIPPCLASSDLTSDGNNNTLFSLKGGRKQKTSYGPAHISSKKKGANLSDIRADLCCPICMSLITSAFMTTCGHTFCYECINRHLQVKQCCPTCQQHLTKENIYPNFLLSKFLGNYHDLDTLSAGNRSNSLHKVREVLMKDDSIDTDDIDQLLKLLCTKRALLTQQEKRSDMQMLRYFLTMARSRKQNEIDGLNQQLSVIESHLKHVSRNVSDLADINQSNPKTRIPESEGGEGGSLAECGAQVPNCPTAAAAGNPGGCGGHSPGHECPHPKRQAVPQLSEIENLQIQKIDMESSVQARRINDYYDDLEGLYFENGTRRSGKESLEDIQGFMETLSRFSRYTRYKPVATLRYGEQSSSAAIVASIEFDRDEEYFAVAGVTRKIKIYDYNNILEQTQMWTQSAQPKNAWYRSYCAQNHPSGGNGGNSGSGASSEDSQEMNQTDISRAIHHMPHYPAAEISNNSKISCLSFNSYIKSQLSCSDYDGVVSLWDVNTQTMTTQFDEHDKRCWSLDFSKIDPTRLCSGSDDGRVKVWITNRRNSVMTLDGKANVCCVRFSPTNSNIISFGSADHKIHCYDLRQPRIPVHILKGHRRAVSYTRFLNNNQIVSASTDNTLKLWDLTTQTCTRTYVGHVNEKNFVGLTILNDEWISCGSENNMLYTYHRNIKRPIVVHKFGSNSQLASDLGGSGETVAEADPSLFVSAVCWKQKSNTMLAANSQGIIKILEME
ncbi:hypothetical protein H4219_003798 [Mycoemilia scoparia]|uniref:RING-type domain-containing protein n=1 Tax=Mycoemilia scoparia TaxID=417184 RepID=A0A9W8DSV6_9FUNG|nr:hypothetical protein H4219_003798 [Mycoemilia scoparia]